MDGLVANPSITAICPLIRDALDPEALSSIPDRIATLQRALRMLLRPVLFRNLAGDLDDRGKGLALLNGTRPGYAGGLPLSLDRFGPFRELSPSRRHLGFKLRPRSAPSGPAFLSFLRIYAPSVEVGVGPVIGTGDGSISRSSPVSRSSILTGRFGLMITTACFPSPRNFTCAPAGYVFM